MELERFFEACRCGELELVKKLEKVVNPDNYACGFCYACEYGHLAVAKWLLLKPDLDIADHYYYDAFSRACRYTHLCVAKWLISIKSTIDILTSVNLSTIYLTVSSSIYLRLVDRFKDIVDRFRDMVDRFRYMETDSGRYGR